jgi:hypothetical protein
MAEVRQDQFVDRECQRGPRRAGCREQVLGVEPPLGDQPGVFLMALGGAVRAEVVVPAIDGDDGGIARIVEAIGGGSVAAGHGGGSEAGPSRYMYRLGRDLFAALPAAGRYPKSRIRRDLHPVGARGFEPPASRSRTVRSSHAELRPVHQPRTCIITACRSLSIAPPRHFGPDDGGRFHARL